MEINFWKDKNVFVTGADGFIGGWLAKTLVEKGAKVIVVIRDLKKETALDLHNLKDKKEIYIVGENGDGKTLLLQGITIALKGVEEGDVFNLVKPQNNYTFSAVD